jgi:hypothetical protein
VRVDAAIWKAGEQEATQFHECWEFIADEVHRVVKDIKDKRIVYRRETTSKFDAGNVRRDLIESKILEIKARAFASSTKH